MYLVIFTDKDIWSITKWENGVFLILSIEAGLKFACRKHACEFYIKVLIQVYQSPQKQILIRWMEHNKPFPGVIHATWQIEDMK